MWHVRLLWLPLCFALWIAYFATSLALHRRLLRRLRSAHHVLWLDLGAPTLLDIVGSRGSPDTSAPGKLTYSGWLSTKSYGQLDDAEVARLAGYLKWRTWALALLGAFTLIAAWALRQQ